MSKIDREKGMNNCKFSLNGKQIYKSRKSTVFPNHSNFKAFKSQNSTQLEIAKIWKIQIQDKKMKLCTLIECLLEVEKWRNYTMNRNEMISVVLLQGKNICPKRQTCRSVEEHVSALAETLVITSGEASR